MEANVTKVSRLIYSQDFISERSDLQFFSEMEINGGELIVNALTSSK